MIKPRGSLLLVEDSSDDEELATFALREVGITDVTVARDGEEALSCLLGSEAMAHRALPAVVLLDLHMPRVDGLEVLRQLRADARTRSLPVVMLTASGDPEDCARAYAAGANSFVGKPTAFGDYRKAVQQVGEYWVFLNRPGRSDDGAAPGGGPGRASENDDE